MQPIPAAWWKALLLSYAGTSHVNKIKNKKNKSLAAKSNAVVEINTMICVCGGWSTEEGTNFSEKDGKGTAWVEGILTSSVLPGARISVCEESVGWGVVHLTRPLMKFRFNGRPRHCQCAGHGHMVASDSPASLNDRCVRLASQHHE